MLRFKRPALPPDFPQKVAQAKQDVEQKIGQRNSNPLPSGKKKRKKKAFNFPDKWREYKAAFAKAQFGKCGYCEIMVIGGQPGDVEHFAPKGEVWEVDEAAPGQEVPFLSTVKGRKPKVLSEQGYWWLAYEWSNYLLSCAVCNQYWKGAIFPVREQPRNLPPSKAIKELPLLLNPFNRRDPGKHLRFSEIGQIEALNQSAIGLATIRTCGLDRDSLVKSRLEKASRAYKLVQELSQAGDDQTETRRVLKQFYDLGNAKYIHAGMVRIIFEELCQTKWGVLEELVGRTN